MCSVALGVDMLHSNRIVLRIHMLYAAHEGRAQAKQVVVQCMPTQLLLPNISGSMQISCHIHLCSSCVLHTGRHWLCSRQGLQVCGSGTAIRAAASESAGMTLRTAATWAVLQSFKLIIVGLLDTAVSSYQYTMPCVGKGLLLHTMASASCWACCRVQTPVCVIHLTISVKLLMCSTGCLDLAVTKVMLDRDYSTTVMSDCNLHGRC